MDAAGLAWFQRAQAEVTDRIDAVGADGWDADALPGWTVLDLVAHLVADQLRVPLLLAGRTADEVPTGTARSVDADPLGAWESAADDALTAWAQPTATEGVVLLPSGPVPATAYLAELTVVLTVHAWDLARATGGDTRLDAALVSAALALDRSPEAAQGLLAADAPALVVPDGADPQTRLLARRGRRA